MTPLERIQNVPVMVIGPTGDGKTTSLTHLYNDKGEIIREGIPPEYILIMNIENKPLPTRLAGKIQQLMPKTHKEYKTMMEMLFVIFSEKDNNKKMVMMKNFFNMYKVDLRQIKVLAIDSLSALTDKIRLWAEVSFSGYSVYKQHNLEIGVVLDNIKKMPLKTVVIALPEREPVESRNPKIYARVSGQEWKFGGIEKEFTVVLWTNPVYGEDENQEVIDVLFQYKPNRFNSAKAPVGMFNGKLKNNMREVYESIHKYYSGV
jgi:ABC-type oligopeptide transport system ATPase subunit